MLIVITTLLLGACNTGDSANEDMPLIDIYSLALDALMEEDKALNHDMAFIAIDLSNFKDLNETGKQAVLEYFSSNYEVAVMDATFEELKEKGYYNEETMVLDGVLLEDGES